jgi:hypothetical protein
MEPKRSKTNDSKWESTGMNYSSPWRKKNFIFYRTAFTVRNIKEAPEGRAFLLEKLIEHFIDEADKSSGIKAAKCSIIIRSAILEKPIQIPYRTMVQNEPQVVMQQFDDVNQSGKNQGRPSLYSQPIHIEVKKHTHTCRIFLCRLLSALRKRRQKSW